MSASKEMAEPERVIAIKRRKIIPAPGGGDRLGWRWVYDVFGSGGAELVSDVKLAFARRVARQAAKGGSSVVIIEEWKCQ